MLALILALVIQPSIVHILIDDAGYGDFGHASPWSTPTLDFLCNDGVRFAAGYAYPTCTPTRAATLSGLSAERLGLVGPLKPTSTKGLKASVVTIAEALRERGYQTAHVGKWHVGCSQPEHRPTQQGFGFARWTCVSGNAEPLDWWEQDAVVESYFKGPQWSALNATLTVRQRDAMLEFLATRDPERPFYAQLWFSRAHGPLPTSRPVSWAEIDGAVAAVLAAVPADTLVIVASDNGALAGRYNAPLTGTKGGVLDGGIRVPVCAWGAGVAGGRVVDEPMTERDWWPTFVLGAGGTLPAVMDGRDLRAVLNGSGARGAPHPLEIWQNKMLIDWPFKLRKASGEWRLFDVGSVGEVGVNDPDRLAAMIARRKVWLSQP